MADLLEISMEDEGRVAVLTLNRPDALNALSLALEGAIGDALADLTCNAAVRAIILTGAGRAFSVGVDLKELAAGTAMAQRVWHGPECLASRMRASPVPIIAAVNGYAITGGLELALNCDFILAGASARFADTHARVGITPSWGLSQILPRRIGEARALQMSLTGAYVDSMTAAQWGLANEAVADADLLRRARAIATEIAETDRTTMERIRALMKAGSGHPLDKAISMEAAIFDTHIATVTPDAVATSRARVQARGKRIAGESE